MRKVTIKRGVHPREGRGGKRVTGPLPVINAAPPSTVAIALSHREGLPYESVVKAGDRVLMGQKVGRPLDSFCTPTHASVSGVVKGIQQRTLIGGQRIDCVIIENDGLDERDESFRRFDDPFTADKQALIEAIREAGIVGLGGAAFPTHLKLIPPEGTQIECLILNGAECEPYLTSDHRMMVDHPDKVIDGMLITAYITGAKKLKIGVELNKPDAIEALRKASEGKGIEVVPLKVKYPQGGEKQLIESLTKRQVPSGKLPLDIGCVVMNVSTAAHLSDAIRYGLPITERVITVAGEVKNPCNIRVRVGTDLGSVIEQCGGLNEGVNKMIIGGPMMGHSVHSVHTPTEKATGGILLMRDEGKYTDDPENCIRCGRCVRACPAGLLPLNLYELSRKGMHELARDRYNVWDCIDCGACSYICPSKLPIVHMIRVTKHALNGK